MKKKNEVKENVGITLIALIITVIVMLILAGVTINLTIGENGIFKKSDEGAEIYKNSAKDEASSLNDVDSKMGELINQYHEGNGGETNPTTVEDAKGKKFEDTTTIIDKNGEEVTIPGGFSVSPDSSDDVNGGIVVVDKNKNEFVWVPVPDPTTMYVEESVIIAGEYATTKRYSKLRIKSGESLMSNKPKDTTGVKEPEFLIDVTHGDGSTTEERGISQLKEVLAIEGNSDTAVLENYSQALVEEYNAMIESVIKYKGFYIARYELTGVLNNPTSKSGEVLINQNWYALKKACNNMINNEYVQSCMIYGCQWDETLSWIIRSGAKTEEEINNDSSSWGNYSIYCEETGSNETWKANNIYDLAGNCREWTQEASGTSSRIERDSNSNHSVKSRNNNKPYYSSNSISTRPTLILK